MRPFTYEVRDLMTLADVARKNECTVEDIRRHNTSLSQVRCDEIVLSETMVELPPTLQLKGSTYGQLEAPKEFAERYFQLRHKLNALSGRMRMSDARKVPHPELKSKVELASEIISSEAQKQADELKELDPSQLQMVTVANAVNADAAAKAVEEIDRTFLSTPLVSLAMNNQSVMSSAPPRRKPNVLAHSTPSNTGSGVTSDRPLDSSSDMILQFTWYDRKSVVNVKDIWCVLLEQPLWAMVDAIECRTTLLPYPFTKNSMLYISGTFYIDTRHDNPADLSEVIREWDPLGTGEPLYGKCPVKSMDTLLKDVPVRFNEMCVFRHCGTCDHYFYWSDIQTISPESTLETTEFPRRIYLAAEKALECDVCKKLPATILTYGDRLTPKNPTLFCPICYRVMHHNSDGQEVNDGFVKFELPPGKHY